MFKRQQDTNESDRKIMERGARRCAAVIVFALLFAIFSNLISGCRKDEPAKIYEVRTSGITYRTSEENKRIKEPVITETVYWVVGGE